MKSLQYNNKFEKQCIQVLWKMTGKLTKPFVSRLNLKNTFRPDTRSSVRLAGASLPSQGMFSSLADQPYEREPCSTGIIPALGRAVPEHKMAAAQGWEWSKAFQILATLEKYLCMLLCVKIKISLFIKIWFLESLVNRAAPRSISITANVMSECLFVLLCRKPRPLRGNKGTFYDQMEDYQGGIIDLNPPFMTLNSE